jgi:hypothetical protein
MPFWSKDHSKTGLSASLSPEELINLAKRYVVQETIGPLKRIARVLGIGLAGAGVFGLGAVIVLIGVLRVLQTETGTVFGHDWTFAPYLLTAATGVALVMLVVWAFGSALKVPEAESHSGTGVSPATTRE